MQDNTCFFPGQIVVLKSGSPDMTVEDVRDNGTVLCSWFPALTSTESLTGVFNAETLRLGRGEPLDGYPDTQLHPGQIVSLRSTGPRMTVSFVQDDAHVKQVSCVWFGANGKAHTPSSATFHPSALVVRD